MTRDDLLCRVRDLNARDKAVAEEMRALNRWRKFTLGGHASVECGVRVDTEQIELRASFHPGSFVHQIEEDWTALLSDEDRWREFRAFMDRWHAFVCGDGDLP